MTTGRGFARRIVRGIGWTFITIGVILVLFVVYELFVTDFVTGRHQDSLREQLAERGVPEVAIPGEAVGILRIPDVDLDIAVVEGVGHEALKKGPGHYPDTPMPGEGGNVAIAGHRTTYARPFWDLDELGPGDKIVLFTRDGRFVYRVRWARVVQPTQVEVVSGTLKPSLTLTTCHPKFSARQRLVVRALRVGKVGSAAAVIKGAE